MARVVSSSKTSGCARMGILILAFAFATALFTIPMSSGEGSGFQFGAISSEATHAPSQYPAQAYRDLKHSGCGSSQYLRFSYNLKAQAGVTSNVTSYEWQSSRNYDGHWYSGDIYQGTRGSVTIMANAIDWKRTTFYCKQ